MLRPDSAVGLANRAQAYLLQRDFRLAILDCTAALRLDPRHTKSWMRRAAARDRLGLHDAALSDLRVAQFLEPHNRAVLAEARKVEEAARACRRRLPAVALAVV
jgi:tetratricopeptide (TPR) repeat protein